MIGLNYALSGSINCSSLIQFSIDWDQCLKQRICSVDSNQRLSLKLHIYLNLSIGNRGLDGMGIEDKRGENYRNCCCLRQSVTFNSCRRLICMKRQRNPTKRGRKFLWLKKTSSPSSSQPLLNSTKWTPNFESFLLFSPLSATSTFTSTSSLESIYRQSFNRNLRSSNESFLKSCA